MTSTSLHWRLCVLPVVFSTANMSSRCGLSTRSVERACVLASGLSLLDEKTPQTYEEAVSSVDSTKWKEAMKKEIHSCEKNNTWGLVCRNELSHDVNVIPVKWVYKIKTDENGAVTEYKARITPKGFKQRHGVDYFEVFAHTGKYKSLRVLLSLAATYDLELNQLDVPSAFVRAELEEDVYMEMPRGFEVDGMVCKLQKSLYGLKQSPRNWYLLVSVFIKDEMGFNACVSDPCLFFRQSRTGKLMLLFLFVDDMQGAYDQEDSDEWSEAKTKLKQRFDVKDLGESVWMLGMRITRDRSKRLIKLDQELYITKMLEKYDLVQCKVAMTPAEQNNGAQEDDADGGGKSVELLKYQELVGSLLYAAISTRPDIAYAVGRLTRHMQAPLQRHWKAAQRVLRYLAGSRQEGLWFGRMNRQSFNQGRYAEVHAYSDSDWGSDKSDRKSVTGWIAYVNGDPVSWASKKQSTVAQSSCEAELYAASAATNELLWLRSLLSELGIASRTPSILRVDNQGAIEVAKHGVKSDRTKHVDIKYHHITDVIEKGLIKIEWVTTEEQQADIMTKALAVQTFSKLQDAIMHCST